MPNQKSWLLLLLLAISTALFSQSNAGNTYETAEYKVDFPTKPNISSQKIPSAIGELLMIIASYEPKEAGTNDNLVYLAMESTYPNGTIHSDSTALLDKFFRGSIDGAAKSANGQLLTETSGTIGKYPSRTIEIDYGNGQAVIKMTMVLREQKMIMLQTITETSKYPNVAVDNFFSSFSLM